MQATIKKDKAMKLPTVIILGLISSFVLWSSIYVLFTTIWNGIQ